MRKTIFKKIMGSVLAASMTVGMIPVSSLAADEYVTAQEWVETEEGDIDVTDALGHTYASAYYGLWNKTYAMGQEIDRETQEIIEPGVDISYAFYTPETWEAAGSCVYVLIPDGYTPEEFANESSWMDVAYDYGFTVAFLADENGAWDLDQEEYYLDYVIGVSTDLSSRSIVNYNESSLYIVGYGTGSTVANYVTMNLANMFAGAVFMGTPEISAEEVEEIGNMNQFDKPLYGSYERKEGTVQKDCNIPVWIVNDAEPNTALEDYWKAANDVSEEAVWNEYATIYNQDLIFEDEQATYEAASYVWISEMENASEMYDYDFTSYMWENFLCKLLRLRAKQDGTLYYNSAEKLEDLEYYDTEINGMKRYWAVYTPESYDGSEAYPMVLFLHGHAHGINGFFVNTGMWRSAEKYDFILVYALGDPCNRDVNVDCFNWNTYGDNLQYEIEYFNTLLDSVEEDYNIDVSRVYGTSHSAGSGMLNQLAEEMPERFAAFAPVGSPGVIYSSEEELPEADENSVKYAYTVIYGSNEDEYSPEKMTMQVKRAMLADGMDIDTEGYSYNNGHYTMTTYYDEESGLPLVKSYLWDDTIHTYLQEYFDAVWNDVSGYSRNENGELCYCGVVIG